MTTVFLRPNYFDMPTRRASAGVIAPVASPPVASRAAASQSDELPRYVGAQSTPNTDTVALNSHLDANPLFIDGTKNDEFQITPANLEFAKTQFAIDSDFLDLVKSGEAHCAVVYHSENGQLKVDAYRAAAAAGKTSAFSAYVVKNPDFDPGKVYKNELMTKLADGRYFGTVIPSRQLVVPESADPSVVEYLRSNGFQAKEKVAFDDFGHTPAFKQMFGIPDGMSVQMYEMQKKSFSEKFKVFYELVKESPEYRMYKIGDVMNEIGSAMALGVITPELWKQGTAYGIASTISSIGNIGGPAIGIVGESLLGSVVDNAVNSARPVENLKKIELYTAAAYAAKIGCTVGMHPSIIHMFGSHPGTAFLGMYAGSAVIGSLIGVVNGKANMAIHDQLINKAPNLKSSDYAKNYYQILGVEMSISRALYLGAYSAAVAAVAAFPAASLPMAAVGGALWAASNFVWPLYREKPEVKTVIEGSAFIHQGDRYVFDSGWEASFEGGKGRLVREDANHFSIAMDDGELRVKNDLPHAVLIQHKRRLKDYLPEFLKPKALGEKERWELDNGGQTVVVSRYGKGFEVESAGPNEFVVRRAG